MKHPKKTKATVSCYKARRDDTPAPLKGAMDDAIDERYRLRNAARVLYHLGDRISDPHQIPGLTDMKLQGYGLMVRYLAEQMEAHAEALGDALEKLEVMEAQEVGANRLAVVGRSNH